MQVMNVPLWATNIKIRWILPLLLVCMLQHAWGQVVQGENMVLTVNNKSTSVELRWIPTNFSFFVQSMQKGIKVERVETNVTTVTSDAFAGNIQTFYPENFLNKNIHPGDSEMVALKKLTELILDQQKDSAALRSYALLIINSSYNRELAMELGQLFIDSTCVPGKKYAYRISLNNESPSNNIIGVDTKQKTLYPAIRWGAHTAYLKNALMEWEAQENEKYFSAYHLEKSEDGKTYQRLTNRPLNRVQAQDEKNKTTVDYRDTAVQKGKVYYYRVAAVNYCGEVVKYSEPIKIYIKRFLEFLPEVDSIYNQGKINYIQCSLHLAEGKTPMADIKSVILQKSDSLRTGYKNLETLKKIQETFTLTDADLPEQLNRKHYRLAVVGVDLDTMYSYPKYFFAYDSVPPAVPVGLTGTVNDSGIVYLTWKGNKEKDLQGYRVYTNNALHEEFVEVTNRFVNGTEFYDTLFTKTLEKNVYYCISAVDLNYNNSKKCTPIKIKRPDKIAPVEVSVLKLTSTIKGVEIIFTHSPSNDVAHHYLFRKSGMDSVMIKDFGQQAFVKEEYLDTTLYPGKEYTYIFSVVDSSGNTTLTRQKLYHETGFRPAPLLKEGKADRDKRSIVLTWDQVPEPVYSIQIYRKTNDGNWNLYKTLFEKEALSFTDKDLNINNTYHYKIKMTFSTGISSMMSKEISVIY